MLCKKYEITGFPSIFAFSNGIWVSSRSQSCTVSVHVGETSLNPYCLWPLFNRFV